MLFSSPIFFIFFVAFITIYLFVPIKYSNYVLIFSSLIFYAWWKAEYIWIPLLLMQIAFIGGRWISSDNNAKKKKNRLVISIVILFIPLVFYKYVNFIFIDVLFSFAGQAEKIVNASLPLGISFITFTLTAYLVDVYKKRFQSDKSAALVLAYVLFFPHLIAGPILHPGELIPQLERKKHKLCRKMLAPIVIFSIGLFKKLVIADQIGNAVTPVFSGTVIPTGPEAVIAIVGFAVQIFCDFSGYTDMALALALAIGIRLPNNFEQPYVARSISALWRRWHITLTRFLMRHVYSPISLWAMHRPVYRRLSPMLRLIVSVVVPVNVTFILSGLWHGAGWNFVCFGAVTGIAMTIESLWRWRRLPSLPGVAAWGLAMGAFLISLVFFRSPTIGRAVEILQAPFVGSWADWATITSQYAFQLFLIGAFALCHRFDDHRRMKAIARKWRPEIVWGAVALCWVLAIGVSQGSSGNFVYFEF